MDDIVEKTDTNARRRRSLRPAIILVVILLIAGITVFIIALNSHNKTPENDATEEIPAEQIVGDSKDTKKEETPEEPEEKEPEEIVEEKAPVKQDGEDPNNLEELTGVINYADVSDDTLMIRVSINQYLETGTCELSLYAKETNDSFSLTDEIAPIASTSSCSFDIATSLLTGGKYDITVSLLSGDKKGTIKGEVDV